MMKSIHPIDRRNGVMMIVLSIGIVWYSWIDGLFPAAVTYHDKTIAVKADVESGGNDSTISVGDDVLICGEGERLRRWCVAEFTRSLESPNGHREEITTGTGFRAGTGRGTGCARIDGSYLKLSGTYSYDSFGTYNCPTGHPQVIQGWKIEFKVNEKE